MSRSISISYEDGDGDHDIEIPSPRDLLGTQGPSVVFWRLPRLREIGISRLADLGVMDPVVFHGWDGLAELRREIRLLDDDLANVDFHLEAKAEWLANLIYCYHLLAETAPPGSTPVFVIG